jgi:uncharacterized protein involved in outer membrane biogenesis
MRAILIIIIVAIVALIAAIGTGFLDINQVRGGSAPQVSATENGVVARGGEAPAFKVETGSVKVTAKETTVKLPAVKVERPGADQADAATNNAM